MGRDRLSLSSVLEKIMSHYNINQLYVFLDPVALKVAQRITLGKIRKTYISDISDFYYHAIDSAEKFIAIASLKKSLLPEFILVLDKLVHISTQNGGSSWVMVIVCNDDRVMNRLLKAAYDARIPLTVPPSLDMVMGICSKTFCQRPKKNTSSFSIVCCGPEFIDLEVLKESADLIAIEGNVCEGELDIAYGSGEIAIVAVGSIIDEILGFANQENLHNEITIYGIVDLDVNLDEKLLSILEKHANILLIRNDDIISERLRFIAEKLLEEGKIPYIPNIISIGDLVGSDNENVKVGLRSIIKDILGKGLYFNKQSIRTSMDAGIECDKKIVELLDAIDKKVARTLRIYVKPIYGENGIHADDFYDAYSVTKTTSNYNAYTIIAHLTEILGNIKHIDRIIHSPARIILIFSSMFLTGSQKKAILKELTKELGKHVKIVSYEEILQKIDIIERFEKIIVT